jgi:class III poly(R)-hydroxyalkanoic acid synthase PhaE subunit
MPTANATGMQEEFVKNIAESSARLATVWSEAVKRAGAQNVYDTYEKLMLSWINPTAFMRIVDSTSVGLKFQELINLASQDLPEIVKHAGDHEKMTRIKDKWMRSYEKLVREMLGVPAPSEIERFIQPWRSLMENFTGLGGGTMSPFGSMPGSMGWPFPITTAVGRSLIPLWSETYENTIGKLFRLPGLGLTREYEERAKKALDAQMRFLNTLPDFQEQVLSASKAAMDKVVDHISKIDIKQVSPETYQLFYKIWVSNNEDAFIELFRSETFCRTLANTIHRGLDAKKKMDTVMENWLSFWNIPGGKDMDEVYQAVYEMKKRIRWLEQELGDLRQKIADSPRKEFAS